MKKDEFNKSFQLPLMELNIEKLHIPEIEYQADLLITTNILTKMNSLPCQIVFISASSMNPFPCQNKYIPGQKTN